MVPVSFRQNTHQMGEKVIHNQSRGHPRWIGNYSFSDDYCVNFLLLYPGKDEKRHLSEIITDAYWGEQRDFEWDLLADTPPDSIPCTDTFEEDGLGQGVNQVFFATADVPPVEWVQRIAWKYPTLEVILDYQKESTELLGRIWFSEGRLYKACHLTRFTALDILEHRETLPASQRGPVRTSKAARGVLTLVKEPKTT